MNIVSRRSSSEEEPKPRSSSFSSQHSNLSGLVISSPTEARRLPDSYVTGSNPPATFSRASDFGDTPRKNSITSLLSYTGRKHKKPKPYKAIVPKVRPKRPDQLEKPETHKLTDFWGASGVGEWQVREKPHFTNQLEFHNLYGDRVSFEDFERTYPRDPNVVLPGQEPLPDILEERSLPDPPSGPVSLRGLPNMETSLMVPGGPDRRAQIQDARDMYQTITRNAERTNSAVPPYEFLELIGKGSFGRVYKCRDKETSTLVAVKIVNIDDMDFTMDPRERDETVKDFRKEVSILQQLKDSKAKNVNLIHDAFDLHSQLWIISDYCTGGSVRTLMRANATSGLEETFIIPVARELAVAMKCVHDIGVIHRDIKCTNVYVTEDGQIQLGDFGIVGIMDDNAASKRTTIIGTPWYMPREMHTDDFSVAGGYGKEIDIWSYGCTVYEMATGLAPNARVPQHMLGSVLEQSAPRLEEGGSYSEGLRDFVAFCLDSNPATRPSADQILQHPYIAGTSRNYPTKSLAALIERYTIWEFKGGQRTSLFNPGGAAAPISAEQHPDQVDEDADDWNFSTSDSFNQEFGRRYSQFMLGQGDDVPFDVPAGAGLPPLQTKDLSVFERIQKEHQEKSATRGEMSLDRLFNPGAAPYELHTPVDAAPATDHMSDLPLRNMGAGAPRESTLMIDLDASPTYDSGPTFNFDFDDIPTIKAKSRRSLPDDEDEEEEDTYQYGAQDDKRATKDWKFPTLTPAAKAAAQPKRATMEWTFSNAEPAEPDSPEAVMNLPPIGGGDTAPNFRPQLKHTATVPVGQFNDYLHTNQAHAAAPSLMLNEPVRDSVSSMIDLGDFDAPPLTLKDTTRGSVSSMIDLGDLADPSEIVRPATASSTTGSTSTEMTSGNPFDLEDPDPYPDGSRYSFHKQWQSDGGQSNGNRSSLRNVPMHARGQSLSSTESELERTSPAPVKHRYDEAMKREDDNYDHNGMGDRIGYDEDVYYQNDIDGDTLDDIDTEIEMLREKEGWAHRAMRRIIVPQVSDANFPPTIAGNGNGTAAALPRSLSVAHSRGQSNGYQTSPPRETLAFPEVRAPSARALEEDAPPAVVAAEVEQMLEDLRMAFKATGSALRHRAGLGQDEAKEMLFSSFESVGEEQDHGFESAGSMGPRSGGEGGDEEGF